MEDEGRARSGRDLLVDLLLENFRAIIGDVVVAPQIPIVPSLQVLHVRVDEEASI